MEKEALARSVEFFKRKNLKVDTLITDRHPVVQKWVRENMLTTTHYYDVWHISKGEMI